MSTLKHEKIVRLTEMLISETNKGNMKWEIKYANHFEIQLLCGYVNVWCENGFNQHKGYDTRVNYHGFKQPNYYARFCDSYGNAVTSVIHNNDLFSRLYHAVADVFYEADATLEAMIEDLKEVTKSE
jgi:hypothetical protein